MYWMWVIVSFVQGSWQIDIQLHKCISLLFPEPDILMIVKYPGILKKHTISLLLPIMMKTDAKSFFSALISYATGSWPKSSI